MDVMPEPPPRTLADRSSPADRVVASAAVVVAVFVIALGFGFDVSETLEVLVTGVALVGVMGIAGGIAWAVGQIVEWLAEEAPG